MRQSSRFTKVVAALAATVSFLRIMHLARGGSRPKGILSTNKSSTDRGHRPKRPINGETPA